MLTFSRLRYLHLAYFSKPVGERLLYRTIHRRRFRKILEIGISSTGRTLRMLEQARRSSPGEAIRYAAIDLFESRPQDNAGWSLKEAHRVLKTTGSNVQLIPGDPGSALVRAANALQNQDLVLISSDHDDAALERAWFYLPRMLHGSSQVYRESRGAEGSGPVLQLIARQEIESRATAHRPRRAA